ncbi:hypothetical protein AAHB53_07195 [Niallia circulans]
MGVIKTNKWLEDNFYEPTTICAHFQSAFDGDKPQNIYRYLMRFGMYKPSRHSRQAFEKMKEQDTWNKLERIFSKYKKNGRDQIYPYMYFPFSLHGEEKKINRVYHFLISFSYLLVM